MPLYRPPAGAGSARGEGAGTPAQPPQQSVHASHSVPDGLGAGDAYAYVDTTPASLYKVSFKLQGPEISFVPHFPSCKGVTYV